MLHQLSNGRYTVEVSDAGGGRSSCDGIALNRWSEDPVEDNQGFFIYLRDLDSGALWSSTLQPTVTKPDRYKVSDGGNSVRIERQDNGILAMTEISVSERANLEVRTITLTNLGKVSRNIELTSLIELALAPPQTDLGHPAFSKLFVETALLRSSGAITARRRPRVKGEASPTVFHALSGAAVETWESDRLLLIGRGRSTQSPALLMHGSVGNVLEPALSLRTRVDIAPGGQAKLCFILGISPTRTAIPGLLRPFAASRLPAATRRFRPLPESAVVSGFSAGGSEYVIDLPWSGEGLAVPPMPWVNVIANERFGSIVSESGAGCTWSRNSQLNRLTPWYNDPVCDPHGEAFYLRDEVSGAFWSPLPGPVPAATAYSVRHGFGYSSFRSEWADIVQDVTQFVARRDPVKIVSLRFTNRGSVTRDLSLYAYQRLILGSQAAAPGAIRAWCRQGVLCASNNAGAEFAAGITFSTVVGPPPQTEQVCRDRKIFIGVNGSPRDPAALHRRNLVEAGLDPDPCFARRVRFNLAAGESITWNILLGEATDEAELEDLLGRYEDQVAVAVAREESIGFWRDSLSAIRVRTPNPDVDALLNGWLPYQALSCRMWGRTALYQSSGAYGFRDQLQDAGNICALWPDLARKQILLHARHQFEQGDVMHWWHGAPTERGIRTRFSDDLLWLPFVVCDYLRRTGDRAILDEQLSFLHAPELAEKEEDRYLAAESGPGGSLYEHCCRALDRSMTQGAHGLPLMGCGDWNDGMNRVGRRGKGESVWLGFFLVRLLDLFVPLTEARGDAGRTASYRAHRQRLVASLDANGWDGDWYLRAFYDDGTPLGTARARECRLDGLVQAWAVLSEASRPARSVSAMRAVQMQLVDVEAGLIKLLTPPFVSSTEDPGYIRGYVAGVRENGGQYTHAACWMVAAAAGLGWRDVAMRWFALLTPGWHSRDSRAQARYKVEPYVIAADIYGAAPHNGRGGWTWYTGSAGWAYSVGLESLLGLRLDGGKALVLRPCIPDEWPAYEIDYRLPGSRTRFVIRILNPQGCAEAVVGARLNGRDLAPSNGAAVIPLRDDGGCHQVTLTLGAALKRRA